MSLPVAVLAGGRATRLGALAERVPKILIDVAGRPFAEHQLALLRREGVTRVIYCVGHLGVDVERALGDGRAWGMSFEFVSDGPQALGTGGAIRAALPRLGAAFFVMYGDSYLDCDFRAIERAFHQCGRPGLMTVFRNDNRWDRSNVLFEAGRILRYDKVARDPAFRHIDYGLGILTPAAIESWTGRDGAFDLAEVYQRLIARGDLAGVEVGARFYEIGSHEGLEETRALLAARVNVQ